MDQATPPDGARRHVPQSTAALLEEIASLRKQNETQRRELEQLRGAVPLSLPQSNSSESVQPSTMPRFTDFPLEIREMIWAYALPKQLLGNQDIKQNHVVPKDLYVPAVAHVCRESRSFAASKNHTKTLPGEADLPGGEKPSSLSRFTDPTPASWTWFSPCNDTLMIEPQGFRKGFYDANSVLARAAEHIIVEDRHFWEGFHGFSEGLNQNRFYDQKADVLLSQNLIWVHKVYSRPYSESENYARTHGSICSLRNVDFSMREVTQIDPNCPPQFLHRLFGEDNFRVVDLRDTEPVEILRMLGYELFQGMDPDLFLKCSGELANAMKIYKSVAKELFQHLRPLLLEVLVNACHDASKRKSSEGDGILPMPFKSGLISCGLNMEVTWVKELSERLTVRPVHVFVLGEDMWES